MGVSFKVARAGTRYRPKLSQVDEKDDGSKEEPSLHRDGDEATGPKRRNTEGNFIGVGGHIADYSNTLAKSRFQSVSQDLEVSFSLNLFPDGYSIGKPTEGMIFPFFQDVAKWMHPYDKASKTLFSAIEYGKLPGDIFDELPCKYVNGALVCEVRDYRKCMSRPGDPAEGRSPVVHKVHLQMCMENVVKDISSASHGSWTYKDLLEVESRILKALQPELCLDPTPTLDRLSETPLPKKLNLGINEGRKKRKQNGTPVANCVPQNLSHGSSMLSNELFENPKSHMHLPLQDRGVPGAEQINTKQNNIVQEAFGKAISVASQLDYQAAVNFSRSVSSAGRIPSNFVSMSEKDPSDSYVDLGNPGALLLAKRGRSEAQPTSRFNMKRPKQEQLDFLVEQQLEGGQIGASLRPDIQWKRTQLEHHIEIEKGRRARFGREKHSQLSMNENQQAILEGIPKLPTGFLSYLDHRVVQYTMKEEEQSEISNLYKSEVGKSLDIRSNQSNHQQPQEQHLSPLVRSNFPTVMQWNHTGHLVDNNLRTEDATQRRRSLQSPRVSAKGVVHSPASLKSGDISSISVGVPCSTSATTPILGLHMGKAMPLSAAGVGNASLNLGQSDSLLRENQASLPAKQKSNSSVGAPSVTLPSEIKGDPVLERFLKIEMVTKRYKLNYRKQKYDKFVGQRPLSLIPELLAVHLSKSEDTEDLRDVTTDKISMSKCLFGCSNNLCKTRILTFVRCVYQGNGIPVVIREAKDKLVMSEKPKDGMVEVCVLYGDEEERNSVTVPRCCMQTLPNTHYADLFAAQFTSLMKREGYQLSDDQMQFIPSHSVGASSSRPPSITSANPDGGAVEIPCQTPLSGQSSSLLSSMNGSISALNQPQLPSQNILVGDRSLPPGDIQAALRLSAGYLSRTQQLDSPAHLTPMKQQRPWIQRLLPLSRNNSNLLSNPNLEMSNQIFNNPAHLQFQLSRRQGLQHQQQLLMQRKMMAGGAGPAIGMANLGMIQPGGAPGFGDLVSIGSSSNFVGMGGAMSAPIGGQNPGLGDVGQINYLSSHISNFGSLSQQLIAGGMSHPPPAILAELKLAQSRGRALQSGLSIRGNLFDGIGGLNGFGMMHGGYMLGQASSRDGLAHLQYPGMAPTRPPKISATTTNVNNQQQPQQQLHQQQQQLQPSPLQQQQQQLEQPQQIDSKLQPPQTTSLPEHLGHLSPQQINQQTEMSRQQLSYHSPQQISQQTQMSPQQLSNHSPQQISQQTQMSPQQLSSCPTAHQVNAGHVGVDPRSPQLSSQTHGSVGSITSSPVELQGATKSDNNSVNTGLMGGE